MTVYVLWGLVFLTIFIVWYTSPIGRKWLKTLPSMQWYYGSELASRVETVLFAKSDTLLYNRFKALFAGTWSVVLMFGGFDYSPFLIIIPVKYHWIVQALPSLIFALDGIFGEIQRRYTTKPVVLVAPSEETNPPQAVVRAEIAKEKAVEAVTNGK